MRDLRRWRLASSLLTIVVLLSACVNRDQSASPSQSQTAGPIDPRRTTLNIGVASEANSFDPQVNTAQVSAFRFYPNIYETLIRWGNDKEKHSLSFDEATISRFLHTEQLVSSSAITGLSLAWRHRADILDSTA